MIYPFKGMRTTALCYVGLQIITVLLCALPLRAQLKPCFVIHSHAEQCAPERFVACNMLGSLEKWLPDSLSVQPQGVRTYISSAALKAWALKQDFWFSRDKVQHVAACFFVTFSTRIAATAVLNVERKAANVMAGGIATFVGFVREVTDDYQYNNIFSGKDMVADLLGMLLAMLLLTLI